MNPVVTEAQRKAAFGIPCKIKRVDVEVQPGVVESCLAEAADAFRALGQILTQYGYVLRDRDTGIYNCRHIGNDPKKPWSAHAWATAIDVNWATNPDGRQLKTDIPFLAVHDIVALKTRNGWPVFRWGGDWDRDPRTGHSYYDAMHFEIIAPSAALRTGLDFVFKAVKKEVDPMLGLRIGAEGDAVEAWQRVLLKSNPKCLPKWGPDSDFGPETEAATKAEQKKRSIPQTGWVDPQTYASFFGGG